MDPWRWQRVVFENDGAGGGETGGEAGEGGEAGAAGEGGGEGSQGSGAAEPAYLPQISPELRGDEKVRTLLGKYPKLNDLVQAFVGMDGRLQRSVVVPNMENPDPEELKAFRSAMGLPEKAEDYEVTLEAFQGQEGVEELVPILKKAAFAMGLSKNQAQKFTEFVGKLGSVGSKKLAADRKDAADTFEARLLEAVGKDEAKRDETLNLFKRFLVKRMGDNALIKELAAAGLVHNPAFAVKAAEIERYFNEEPFVEGRAQGNGSGAGAKKGTMGSYSPEFEATFGGRK